jgi:hypothetical protein
MGAVVIQIFPVFLLRVLLPLLDCSDPTVANSPGNMLLSLKPAKRNYTEQKFPILYIISEQTGECVLSY